MVPALWGPAVLLCLAQALSKQEQHWVVSLPFVGIGVLLWQLLEYCIHRYRVQTSKMRSSFFVCCALSCQCKPSLLLGPFIMLLCSLKPRCLQKGSSRDVSECRHVFHAHPVRYWAITLHFALHGCHHKFPMDRGRLVFPPLPAVVIAAGIHAAFQSVLPQARPHIMLA